MINATSLDGRRLLEKRLKSVLNSGGSSQTLFRLGSPLRSLANYSHCRH